MATITTVSVEPMSGQAANLKDSPYTFHDVSTTWQEAKRACQKMGSHLVTMETTAEWKALVKYIKSRVKKSKQSFTHWYIGLRKDMTVEGAQIWRWTEVISKGGHVASEGSGKDSRWQPNEPSDSTGEDCGEINAEYPRGFYGYFNNVKCDSKYPSSNPRGYICEKHAF